MRFDHPVKELNHSAANLLIVTTAAANVMYDLLEQQAISLPHQGYAVTWTPERNRGLLLANQTRLIENLESEPILGLELPRTHDAQWLHRWGTWLVLTNESLDLIPGDTEIRSRPVD